MATELSAADWPDGRDACPRRDAAQRTVRRERWRIAALAVGCATAAGFGLVELRLNLRPRVEIYGPDQRPLAARLEFFAYDRSPAAPSPTPRLGDGVAAADGRAWIDLEVPEDGCLARVESPGFGVGFGFVERRGVFPVELAPPERITGSVIDQGGHPVCAAHVAVFGGGPRGVLLTELDTAEDGTFVVDCVSSLVTAWTLRVNAVGYGIESKVWECDSEFGPMLVLRKTEPARGRVVIDGGIALEGLELRVFHLPGVTAHVSADGSFEFANLPPPPLIAYPVIDGLPEGFTCERVAVSAGRETTIHIVRAERLQGRVIDRRTGKPIVGARVFHEHGPRCVSATTSDRYGDFELGLVPPGRIQVHAIVERPPVPGQRSPGTSLMQDMMTVNVVGGEPTGTVILRVE